MATASQLFIPPTTTSKVPPKSTLAKLKAQERRTHATAAMSKSEIQSWISSSAVDKEDRDDSATSHPWQRDQVLNDWPSSVDYARTVLLTHRTKDRIAFLREELLSLVRHAGESTSFASLDSTLIKGHRPIVIPNHGHLPTSFPHLLKIHRYQVPVGSRGGRTRIPSSRRSTDCRKRKRTQARGFGADCELDIHRSG